jgi:hypothetical protein
MSGAYAATDLASRATNALAVALTFSVLVDSGVSD